MNPYLEISSNAESAREIPTQIHKSGQEVRVFMPRFGVIKERKHRLHEVIRLSGINIPVGDEDNPLIIKVASLPSAGMQIYFLDNEDFFNYRNIFNEDTGEIYDDNDQRVVFYNKGVIEIILKLSWIPDVIYCHGWMGCLVPLYARTVHKNENVFKNTKFILTLLPGEFNDSMGADFIENALVTGQSKEAFAGLENPTISDIYKAGISFADAIIIGGPNPDPALVEFAHASGKPVVDGSVEPLSAEAYYELYTSLLEDNVLEENN